MLKTSVALFKFPLLKNFLFEVRPMKELVVNVPESRKKWMVPKLKKVDVETLTASGFSTPSGDGTGFS